MEGPTTTIMQSQIFLMSVFLGALLSILVVITGLQATTVAITVDNSTNQNSTFDSHRQDASPPAERVNTSNLLVQPVLLAPIKISGDNVFIVWPDNNTKPFLTAGAGTDIIPNISDSVLPNWEIFFVRSSDAGKTFGIPLNLSNSPNGTSTGPEIDIHENNEGINSIFVTFWDNKTGNQAPYLVLSRDDGNTFTSPIRLNIR
ncbi:MAG: hypothetical protein WCD28_05465 [Nitrososphaeraceae archaeon]